MIADTPPFLGGLPTLIVVWIDPEGAGSRVTILCRLLRAGRVGLTKEEIRRIVLSKLRIVYRDWRFIKGPFWHREPKAGQRRMDARSFESALVAALLGGLSEAIEKNNQELFTALGRRGQRMRAKDAAKRRKR